MKRRPDSSIILVLGGIILMVLGCYFIFLRPPLLSEDLRYVGASLSQIQATAPGLLIWLRRVFWVMGGYMFATGLLTFYVAVTIFRTGTRGVQVIVALAGLSSIGWMTAVNFIIASDFKWLLLALNLPWLLAVVCWPRKAPSS